MAKKIGAIISLSIIGVLIIATIIMANVSCDYSIKSNIPDKIYIERSTRTTTRVEDSSDFDKIVDYIFNASKESSLTALFNGTLFDKAKVTTVGSTTSPIPTTSNFYVRLAYDNPQTLMNGNKKYKDEDGNEYYYRELVFTVEKTDGLGQVKVYIVPFYDANGVAQESNVYSKYYQVTANYSDLYNLLVEKYNT